MFQFFLYGVILGLVALVIVEVYLRIKYANLLWIQVYPQVYMPDDELGYRYKPNAEGEIRIPGIHRRFRTNNRGFNSRDFVSPKPPGTRRIAIVGPSNSTGIWTDGQDKNFSEILEETLRASGHQVEVMNFSIDGRYRSVHELRIIESEVAVYEPDHVLLDVEIPFVYGTFKRDVYKSHVMIYNYETEFSMKWCEAMIDSVTRHKFLILLYYASYIVRALVRRYMNTHNNFRAAQLRAFVENRIQAPDIRLMPYSVKRSVEALQAVRDKLKERGTKLTIFQYSANLYYREITTKYGLDYLELDVPPIPKYVHDRDGHYRHEGHVEVAKQLFAHLSKSLIVEADQAEAASLSNQTRAKAGD